MKRRGLADGMEFLDRCRPSPPHDPFGGDDPNLVAARVRGTIEPAAPGLELHMASKAVRSRPDRNYHGEVSCAVVQNVCRDHNGRPDERRLMADRMAEIDVIDLVGRRLIGRFGHTRLMRACYEAGPTAG